MKTQFIVGYDVDGDRTVEATLRGRKMHLLRAEQPDGADLGGIYLSDKGKDDNLWYEILAVADGCRYFTPDDVGLFIWLKGYQIGKRAWAHNVGPAERVIDEAWFDESFGPPLMAVEA